MKVAIKVEQILERRPETRSSDKKLLLQIWENEGLTLSETQKQTFLDKCSTAESVTRVRRKLKDKYPASKEVTEARYELFNEYKYNKGDPRQ